MTTRLLLRLLRDRTAAAAAEMAMVMPLLVVLAMGTFELGNYFKDEHILIKGVRDGARFAARQGFASYTGCGATAADVPTALRDDTKLIVRKGTLSSADADLLPTWSDASTTFTVQMSCSTSAGGTTLSGIYSGNATGATGVAPMVTVTASLPYRSVLGAYGFTGKGFSLVATEQAAVTGV
jgi:Flp pilus assembly protein TadG